MVGGDGRIGIENVMNKHYKEAEIQLCTVHLQRECQKYVKPRHKAEMTMDLKEVFSCDDKMIRKQQEWKDGKSSVRNGKNIILFLEIR